MKGKLVAKSLNIIGSLLSIEVERDNLPKNFNMIIVNAADNSIKKEISHEYLENKITVDINRVKIDQGDWHFIITYKLDRYRVESMIVLNEVRDRSLFIEAKTGLTKGVITHNGQIKLTIIENEKFLAQLNSNYKSKVVIDNLAVDNNEFSFGLNNVTDGAIGKLTLKLRNSETEIYLNLTIEKDRLSFDKSELLFAIIMHEGRWDVFIDVIDQNSHISGRLSLKETLVKNKEIYYEKGTENTLLIYRTIHNNISILSGSEDAIFKERNQISGRVLKLKKKRNKGYQMKFSIQTVDKVNIKNVYMNLRSGEESKKIYFTDYLIVEDKNKNLIIDVVYLMDWEKEFHPLYWDVFIEATDSNGLTGNFRINKVSNQAKLKLKKDYFKMALKSANNEIIYPYLTIGNSISFMMREKENYENLTNKIKELFAFIAYLFLKQIYFKRKNIWIGFEKFSKTAQDNGYAFFDYVVQNNLHDDFYYIIDSETRDYQRIRNENKNIIKFMSFKYFLLLFACRLMISSETKRHAYNLRIRTGLLARAIAKKKSVFLQHGVTALKQSSVFKKAAGRGNFDLVIATSKKERDIISEHWKYDHNEIEITGFARWDLLKNKVDQIPKRKIFVMPTWRAWMEDMPEPYFVKTEYYKQYYNFLNSSELHMLLEKNNLELVFFLHPKFKQYIKSFSINHNRVILKEFLDIKVNEEIMESSLMISDYSSVTWDMFYMKKPVLFFQFDSEKYLEYEGSYIDFSEELFGDSAKSVEELIGYIDYYAENSFKMKDAHSLLREKYFKYTDQNNSERIFNAIKKIK